MATKQTNRMKFQMWTPNLNIKSEGSLVGGVVHAFDFLSIEQKEVALKKMSERLLKAKAKAEGLSVVDVPVSKMSLEDLEGNVLDRTSAVTIETSSSEGQ